MARSASEHRILGRESSPFTHRAWVVTASALMLAAILVVRFAVASPSEAVLLLCVVPIVLIATEFGTRGGVAAATLCCGFTLLYAMTTGTDLGLWGYVSRGGSFYFVGAFIGRFSEQRRAREEQHTRWFQVAHDLSCTAGFDGYFKRVNPAWERTFAYSPKEIMARPFIEFVHPDDRATTQAEAAKLMANEMETARFVNRYRAKDGSYRWIEWMARSVPEEGLIYASARDITDRRKLEEELHHIAQHDALTGLFNRRRFEQELSRQLSYAQRYRSGGGVLVLDLDHFKEVNDSQGHSAGDQVLKAVATVLQAHLRKTDLPARLGGDEFAVVLPEVDATGAERVAQKLLDALRERFQATREPRVAASIGVALFDSMTEDELLIAADDAMYEAKRAGGDRFVVSSEMLNRSMRV